eukprot:1733474-Prymnesium_polylepis.1
MASSAGARPLLSGQVVPFRVLGEREQHLQLGTLLHEAPRRVVRVRAAVQLGVEELLPRDGDLELLRLEDHLDVLLCRRRRQ